MAYVIKTPAGKFLAQACTARPSQVEKASLATRFPSLAAAVDFADQKHRRSRKFGSWSVWDTERLCAVYSISGAPSAPRMKRETP